MKATNTQLIDVFSTCSFNYCYSSLQNKTYSIIHGILHGEPVSFDVSAFYRFTSTLYFYNGQATSIVLMAHPVVKFIKKQFCVSDPCINGRYVTSRLVTSASVSLSLCLRLLNLPFVWRAETTVTNQATCSTPSLWLRANTRNSRFETLYGGQFTLSTQLIILNYPVILSHRRSITVLFETYPLYLLHCRIFFYRSHPSLRILILLEGKRKWSTVLLVSDSTHFCDLRALALKVNVDQSLYFAL